MPGEEQGAAGRSNNREGGVLDMASVTCVSYHNRILFPFWILGKMHALQSLATRPCDNNSLLPLLCLAEVPPVLHDHH